jgi:hypothetical protein
MVSMCSEPCSKVMAQVPSHGYNKPWVWRCRVKELLPSAMFYAPDSHFITKRSWYRWRDVTVPFPKRIFPWFWDAYPGDDTTTSLASIVWNLHDTSRRLRLTRTFALVMSSNPNTVLPEAVLQFTGITLSSSTTSATRFAEQLLFLLVGTMPGR